LEITKLADIQPYTKFMVYGLPGTGKTVLASTAPKPLFIDCEAGTMSIKNPGLDVVRIKKWCEMREVFEYLKSDDKHGHETVVLDSLTEMQKLSMDSILTDGAESKPGKDVEIAELRDWQRSMEQIRKMVRAFRDLPMHVIFTALRAETGQDTGEVTYKPSLPGKLSDDVSAAMDIVGYLFVQDMEGENGEVYSVRRLLAQPKGRYVAKDRSGKLGAVLNEPTMPAILDLIYDRKKKEV